jgi:chemotaxis protein CheD
MEIVVRIADMKVSNNPEATLVTHALGSCLGICVYEPQLKVGGLLHFMLPDSRISPQKAKAKPYMFGDVAIPLLFKEIYALGATKKALKVKLVGAAHVLDHTDKFNIGKKNHLMARKLFFKNGVRVAVEEVGGNTHRTVRMDVATGQVTVKVKGGEVFTI